MTATKGNRRPDPRELIAAVGRVAQTWTARTCTDCERPKPLFTAYCDRCAERHGLTAA